MIIFSGLNRTMSDSESSVENEIIRRICRRKKKKKIDEKNDDNPRETSNEPLATLKKAPNQVNQIPDPELKPAEQKTIENATRSSPDPESSKPVSKKLERTSDFDNDALTKIFHEVQGLRNEIQTLKDIKLKPDMSIPTLQRQQQDDGNTELLRQLLGR